MKRLDLSGKKFTRLTVIGRAGFNQYRNARWHCICECGTEKIVLGCHLTDHTTKSCGCLQKEGPQVKIVIHGQCYTPEYRIWIGMISRCTAPSNTSYIFYGARGIKVCDRWLHSFENFFADMGPRPSKRHSIDRKDNDGNYEPGNCRWATAVEQGFNTRRTRQVTVNGQVVSLSYACVLKGIKYGAVASRVRRGMTPEQAMETISRNKPANHLIEFRGRSVTIKEASNITGVKYNTAWSRLDRGMSIEAAFAKAAE